MLGELTRVWQTAVRVTPFSWWSLAIAVVGVVGALLAYGPISRVTGWSRWPTLLALLSLTGVLALTLGPGAWGYDDSLRQCVAEVGRLDLRQLRWLRHSADGLLNVTMLVPLGFFTVLAVRRVWPAAVLVLALPLVVETVQTIIPGRQCSPIDYLTNVTGGLVGVAVGAVVLVVRRHRPAASG